MIRKLALKLLGLQHMEAYAVALAATLPQLIQTINDLDGFIKNQNKVNRALCGNAETAGAAIVKLTEEWEAIKEDIKDLEYELKQLETTRHVQ